MRLIQRHINLQSILTYVVQISNDSLRHTMNSRLQITLHIVRIVYIIFTWGANNCRGDCILMIFSSLSYSVLTAVKCWVRVDTSLSEHLVSVLLFSYWHSIQFSCFFRFRRCCHGSRWLSVAVHQVFWEPWWRAGTDGLQPAQDLQRIAGLASSADSAYRSVRSIT